MATPEESAVQPWKSPMPYLFAGLAAMLGLIAFALAILVCSYLKFSRETRDVEAVAEDGGAKVAPPVFEEKYLVIMAGQEKPTFLATPRCSRAASLSCKTTENSEKEYEEKINSRGIEMGNS
ncbi:hypothetical protein ACS0TY_031889 [Phlomoides rotata]